MSRREEGPADEPFVHRWSRRKIGSDQPATADELQPSGEKAPDIAGEEPSPDRVSVPSGSDAEAFDLPDVESLTVESDFSIFMQEGVPDEIRRLALRRLWRLDPVLANLDGLLDYGGDFSDAATTVENLKTAYQVGRGMLDEEKDPDNDGEDVVVSETDSAETSVEEPEELDENVSSAFTPDEPPKPEV